jgi:hypothetical protein
MYDSNPYSEITHLSDLYHRIRGKIWISLSETFPATTSALVVRHLVIHQASADVVLGFIGRTVRHPPNDDTDSIA